MSLLTDCIEIAEMRDKNIEMSKHLKGIFNIILKNAKKTLTDDVIYDYENIGKEITEYLNLTKEKLEENKRKLQF